MNQKSPSSEVNGRHEVERLANLVTQLQAEVETLRSALARAEEERSLYLKALYENARGTFHFEDLDIEELRKDSAGPMQLIR